MLKRLTIAAAAAVILSIGGATGESQAQSGKKGLVDVTFSLDFITLGRHAPWYVALAKGFYEDEGLNVKIIPGKGSAQVMQAVESGIADIGFVDVPGLVLGWAAPRDRPSSSSRSTTRRFPTPCSRSIPAPT